MSKNDESLMSDILFKETFANIENRRQLERLLELILELPKGFLKDKLEVTYESPLKKNHVNQKSVRGDIMVRFDDTTINIECYTNFNDASIDKSIYYMMRIQANNLHIGDKYYEMGKTIQINFVENCKLDLEEDELVSSFHITYDRNLNVKLMYNEFCIKIVRIDKARELGYTNDELDKWLSFIAARSNEERRDIAEGDELLVELNDWVHKYVNDEETQEILNKWDIQIATNKGIEEGRKQGLEEGLEQGLKQGLEQGLEKGIEQGKAQEKVEVAQNMKKANVKIEDIAKFTGLSIDEIQNLKEDE